MTNEGLALQELRRQVKSLADMVRRDYCAVAIEQTESKTTEGWRTEAKYRVYIDGYKWHNGDTPQKALASLMMEIATKDMEENHEQSE